MAQFDRSRLEGLAQHEFLSPAWLDEFRAIAKEFDIEPLKVDVSLRMNQIIADCPFQDEPLKAFLDTSSGAMVLDLGSLENPDLTVSLDYETAKALFVEFDPQRAIESFVAGKILVTGDMTKLLGMTQIFAGRREDDPMSELLRAITS